MHEKGFTLMEMIVVLVIIGLLISGGIGFYNGFIENSKVIKAKSQISVMQGAVDSWYAEHGLYPTNLDDQMLAGLDTEAKDPWGKEYLIVVTSEGGTDNCYVIRTGYEQIHQNKVVAGRGKNGRSEEPSLVDAT
ncbi:MAG TPA: prepilin-type N-terminal cleavage/methylation domain-containing protein [Syntrophaceticus sp.]|uniref:Prepilin-type N-terminal cleavage/methylation domain-containing protein n=1 Tax=Syntrophaceticus schinkii TaxID=499207 RepID=A0A0B7MJ03_9FIRM|nr:prepilin-type N-terminal cleavage/methylation domain-containing protein [Syntrophaceticus schinkii]HHY30671.1 prepilin-type N-terminal cleavage/methylation domain-containing protein [Syntrophaceticus sp.]MDD2359890.1 prepilin-type N-terminal cleavage/methylation domain-containing protein [Syntrophaceticus schinkii]MDD4261720.1 prepilin-type N-terminal cleavage/methylation domain-containing protein [Syntrophaceticus schinkii]MDD4674892.1 prepilin-type N-terminal cleavage/methylation domain-co